MANTVSVAENGKGRYQQSITAGNHHLIADEPLVAGGDDGGPDPFAFVLAGLGACTSMTLRMYAERKGLALGHIDVRLSHDQVDDAGTRRHRIHRHITLTGNLSDTERQRLMEIANKCPVHRALSQSFALECTLAPVDQP